MGLPGNYMNYGPGWAGASGSPLTLFKGSASEGGMRVPFIATGPGFESGKISNEFVYVADLTPTILEIAGVPHHTGTYSGRKVHPISGTSMLGYLQGKADFVHGEGTAVCYELAGSAAVFSDGYKLLKNNPPFGDKQWHLYRNVDDPTESNDLSAERADVLSRLIAAYEKYAKDVQLIEVPADYNPVLQVQKNVERNQVREILDKVPVTFE